MTDRAAQMDAFLRAGLEGYLGETAELCAQPSVSARNEGLVECADLVGRVLARHGFQVQTLPTAGSPVVVGRAEGQSDRTLLFYNHYDVQPPEPLELWTSPPFEPTVRDGALYARGATDDKGEFVARLAAVDAVRDAHGGSLPCGVTFVLEGQEEIGSPHIAQFVQEHTALLACHGAVWETGGVNQEGDPAMVLGARGILYVELAAETMVQDAHSGYAHFLPNAAWRLHGALATLVGPDGRVCIPGFYDRVRPPSDRDLELLDAKPDLEPWAREVYGVQSLVEGLAGRDLKRSVFNPTCNIDGLTAGHQGAGMKTVIPAGATAKLDFRLVPDQDPDEVFAGLRAHLDAEGFADVAATRLGAMWPYKAAADDPLVVLAAQAAEEVYQRPCRIDPLSGGSSPMYAFAGPLGGIPIITAGVGYPGCRAHAPDEHVRLADFLSGTQHLARIVDGLTKLGKSEL